MIRLILVLAIATSVSACSNVVSAKAIERALEQCSKHEGLRWMSVPDVFDSTTFAEHVYAHCKDGAMVERYYYQKENAQ